jgi:hypothetical protein
VVSGFARRRSFGPEKNGETAFLQFLGNFSRVSPTPHRRGISRQRNPLKTVSHSLAQAFPCPPRQWSKRANSRPQSHSVKVNQTNLLTATGQMTPPREMNKGKTGAGEGNRTLMASLEGWNSTIELHPHRAPIISAALALSIHVRIFSPQ